MRIAVPHNTSRDIARQTLEKKIDQLLSQFGGHAEEMHHEWTGDVLRFRGKARGLSISGTVEVTDAAMILEAKLPLMAKMFEGKIRETVEREASKMFPERRA